MPTGATDIACEFTEGAASIPLSGADRVSVAPMMDWTDRHCRYFLRLVSADVRLYTEMITTGALLFGDAARHLAFDPAEHPVAVQLGGSEPDDLAACARMAAARGYDEVNLNVGCPSERVQRGAFGACLMAEPALVADCVKAMRDAVPVPVTVKHRIGIGRVESYEFMRDFVGAVAAAGCGTFIVHARNAILEGLSPRENREVPPLRYDLAARLKGDFPDLRIVLNGGITTRAQVAGHLGRFDGVMIGRAAYHDPWILADGRRTRAAVVHGIHAYACREVAAGTLLRHVTRHVLGLYHGRPGARQWRRMLSDARRLSQNDPRLILEALAAVESAKLPEVPDERRPQVEVQGS